MTDTRTNGRGELPADDEYRAMLREFSGAAPLGAADLDALHARLTAAAELPLARLRHAADSASRLPAERVPDERGPAAEPAWWEYAARRGRSALWLAAAASVLLTVYVRAHPVETTEVESAALVAGTDVSDAFASAVTTGGSSRSVTSLLVVSAADANTTAEGRTP
jgi:hypothetical protein